MINPDNTKFNQLKAFLYNQYHDYNKLFHIICICEAKLTAKSDKVTSTLDSPSDEIYTRYNYKCEINSNVPTFSGGGLLIYVHSTIYSDECEDLSLSKTHPNLSDEIKLSSDIRWVQFNYKESKNKIKNKNKHLFLLGLVYINPSSVSSLEDGSMFIKAITENIAACKKYNNNNPILIGGDFNLKHCLWSDNCPSTTNPNYQLAEKLIEFMDENNLELINIIYAKHQTTLRPHAAMYKPSTVDLIITNKSTLIRDMNILTDTGLDSDHYPISVSILNHSTHQMSNQLIMNRKREKWRSIDLTHKQWELFRTQLSKYLLLWIDEYGELLSKTNLLLVKNKDNIQNLIDQAAFKLSSIITNTAENIIGKKAVGRKYKKYFNENKEEIQRLLNLISKHKNIYTHWVNQYCATKCKLTNRTQRNK